MMEGQPKRRRWKLWMGVGVVILIVVIVAAASTAGGDGKDTPTTLAAAPATTAASIETATTAVPETTSTSRSTTTSASTTTTTESETAFKESCEAIEFRILSKNPDSHKGERLTVTGEVLEIQEDQGITFMRVAVTKNDWGYDSGDVVCVVCAGSLPNAFEESIIQAWGLCGGSFSYESQAGWNITIPLLQAKYVSTLKR